MQVAVNKRDEKGLGSRGLERGEGAWGTRMQGRFCWTISAIDQQHCKL